MTTGRINQVSTWREQAQGAGEARGAGYGSRGLAPLWLSTVHEARQRAKSLRTPERPRGFSSGCPCGVEAHGVNGGRNSLCYWARARSTKRVGGARLRCSQALPVDPLVADPKTPGARSEGGPRTGPRRLPRGGLRSKVARLPAKELAAAQAFASFGVPQQRFLAGISADSLHPDPG